MALSLHMFVFIFPPCFLIVTAWEVFTDDGCLYSRKYSSFQGFHFFFFFLAVAFCTSFLRFLILGTFCDLIYMSHKNVFKLQKKELNVFLHWHAHKSRPSKLQKSRPLETFYSSKSPAGLLIILF